MFYKRFYMFRDNKKFYMFIDNTNVYMFRGNKNVSMFKDNKNVNMFRDNRNVYMFRDTKNVFTTRDNKSVYMFRDNKIFYTFRDFFSLALINYKSVRQSYLGYPTVAWRVDFTVFKTRPQSSFGVVQSGNLVSYERSRLIDHKTVFGKFKVDVPPLARLVRVIPDHAEGTLDRILGLPDVGKYDVTKNIFISARELNF